MTHSSLPPSGSTTSSPINRVDHRHRLPAVKDQGRRETCLAFAVTAVHEHEKARLTGQLRDLSEEMLFWGCKRVDGDTEDGTSFRSAQTALETSGQVEQHLWHYEPLRVTLGPQYQPPTAATVPGTALRAALEPLDASVEAIKQALAQGALVALGFQMYEGFDVPENHVIPLPTAEEYALGGHVVALVGFDDNMEAGCFILRNSWGEGWADRGYAYLPYAYLSLAPTQVFIVQPNAF